MDFIALISPLILSLFIALIFMPLVIRFSTLMNIVDMPGQRKVHDSPVPTLGGLAFSIAFVITCMVFMPYDHLLYGLLAGLIVIMTIGLIDDLYHLEPWIKFIAEILASLLFIMISGFSIKSFGSLFTADVLTTGRFHIPVTVFCMIGVMNAWNMIDGLDGLAAGVSIIAAVFVAYLAWQCQVNEVVIILLALIGSVAGFLFFNKHPARIYMGDIGSLVLGYVLSAMCIVTVNFRSCDEPVAPVSMAILMGLPIVDAIRVMSLRLLSGHSPFLADNTHLHHNLMAIGLTHKYVVYCIYLLMASCGILALVLSQLPEFIQFYIGSCYALLIFGSVFLLRKIKDKGQKSG